MLENKTEEQAKEEILATATNLRQSRHIKRATESLMQAVYLIIKK